MSTEWIKCPASLIRLKKSGMIGVKLNTRQKEDVFEVYAATRSVGRTARVTGIARNRIQKLVDKHLWDERIAKLDSKVQERTDRTYEDRRTEILSLCDDILKAYRMQLRAGHAPKLSVTELKLLQQIVLVGHGKSESSTDVNFTTLTDEELLAKIDAIRKVNR